VSPNWKPQRAFGTYFHFSVFWIKIVCEPKRETLTHLLEHNFPLEDVSQKEGIL
jgi:hypothetical protein